MNIRNKEGTAFMDKGMVKNKVNVSNVKIT